MKNTGKVLVTGASGFLGRRIVKLFVERRYSVRALVRKTSRIDSLQFPGVEICYGDVTEVESLKLAFEGIDYVIHAAADTSGTLVGARQVTIQGTSNVLDLCAVYPIKKLVYISSCSVYGLADFAPGQMVDETASLERFPERRGAYSWAKLEAEKLVTEAMAQGRAPVVCLRPGTIYGYGGENYTPMIGFSFANKLFVVIGDGSLVIPLVYVDNLAEVIFLAMTREESTGQIYNVVDPQQVDKKRYINTFVRKLYPGARCFYIPYGFFSAVVALQEKLLKALKRQPFLTMYRLASSQNPVVFDSSKIIKELGWQPTFSFEEAVEQILK